VGRKLKKIIPVIKIEVNFNEDDENPFLLDIENKHFIYEF